jgi:hypothetical protein
MTGEDILSAYFLENRARLLEIASFLDRIDRSEQSGSVKQNYRYRAFMKALERLSGTLGKRTWALHMIFSDLSSEPIESGSGLKASGAWERLYHEDY